MDSISAVLDGPRASGAFLLRSIMNPPWALRIEDEAPLTIVAVVAGSAWITPSGSPGSLLTAGDVAIVKGPDHYTVGDDPVTDPQIVIHPDQLCTTLDGTHLAEPMNLGVRTWGNAANGETTLLTGTYTSAGEVSRHLVDALVPVVVVRRTEWESPLIGLLAAEISRDEPGQHVVLDRLLDLLLVAAVREWFARPDSPAPRWYRADGDPIVGRAIRLLQNNPQRPWTVAELARHVGMSRASFARRFSDLAGEPPMAFLTRWRMALAADLLQASDATVTAVAREVGYSSPFTFSTSFKRHHGHSPKQHRQLGRRPATGQAG